MESAEEYYRNNKRVLDIVKVSEYRWQVTYNGSIVGDDRGYSTARDCIIEAYARVQKDHSDAIKYSRPKMLSLSQDILLEKKG